MDELLIEILDAILNGQSEMVEALVQKALEKKIDPETILSQGLIAGMSEVGARFERGDFYIPEMLIAAQAMKAGLSVLKINMPEGDMDKHTKVIIGTVSGDLHDIGKNLVGMMLEGAGFKVIDLGTDVSPEKFVAAVQAHKPAIVAMSALLTTTMINMKTVINLIEALGLRQEVKFMIGGAPVTEDFAHAIGADGYAPDASRAVATANLLSRGQ